MAGLWGLVNNAGICYLFPIEWMPMEIFKHTADVNLWGMIDVTKTFLPLLKKAKGRVVNFSSVAGKGYVIKRKIVHISMKTLNLRKGQQTKQRNRILVDLISKIWLKKVRKVHPVIRVFLRRRQSKLLRPRRWRPFTTTMCQGNRLNYKFHDIFRQGLLTLWLQNGLHASIAEKHVRDF